MPENTMQNQRPKTRAKSYRLIGGIGVIAMCVLAFLGFAAVNSFGLIPEAVVAWLSDLSRWALLISIAAVGMKTSLRRILDVGGQAITLIVAETIFIAGLILLGIHFLS